MRKIALPVIAAIEIAIIAKYKAVRVPIVSASPMLGGLAGYFKAGIRQIAMETVAPSDTEVMRASDKPKRP